MHTSRIVANFPQKIQVNIKICLKLPPILSFMDVEFLLKIPGFQVKSFFLFEGRISRRISQLLWAPEFLENHKQLIIGQFPIVAPHDFC